MLAPHTSPSTTQQQSYQQRARVPYRSAPIQSLQNGQPLRITAIGDKEFHHWQEIAFQSDSHSVSHAVQDQKKLLRDASLTRVANWPNTIEALRKGKERARKAHQEEEERRRCLLDDCEADLMAAQRKVQLEKANRMLYETDDRVKNFASKMVLAAVLEERSQQIQYAQEKKQTEELRELEWARAVTEATARKAKEEEEKKALEKERAKQFKLAQQTQLEYVKQLKIAELRTDREEGKQIAKIAQERLAQEQAEEKRRFENALRNKNSLLEANEKLLERKKIDKQRADEEAQRVVAFANEKEEQMQKRAQRAEMKFQQKQMRRVQNIEKQTAHLRILQEQEEKQSELVATQRTLKSEQKIHNEQIEMEKKRRAACALVESRQQQLQEKQTQREIEQERVKKLKEVWCERARELLIDETNEKEMQRQCAMKVQQYQIWQHKEKEEQIAREREQERLESLLMQKAIQDDEKMFQGYVQSVMAEYASNTTKAAVS